MTEKQLRLLPYSKPFSQRLGAAFFRSLPKSPGVYTMHDASGRIIYVGQSHNLRARLGSYRYVNPDRNSRRLIRLVHSVEQIQWEHCPTADSAKLRENALLRMHRPRFNSMNTWPKAHCFIRVESSNTRLEFSFTREHPEDTANYHGAFKSSCLAGYAALLRQIWTAGHGPTSIYDYPRSLLAAGAPKAFSFEFSAQARMEPHELLEQLTTFLSGESPALIDWLRARLPADGALSVFHRNLITSDLEQIMEFFLRGPARNARLRHRHNMEERIIAQEELDDLLVAQAPSDTTGTNIR